MVVGYLKWRLGKKGIALDFLAWLIIGVLVLVLVVVAIAILTGKGIGALDFIKDIFKWG
jgi:hypothetical protein|tara:strand:+ start:157 stop:333 length:177 start_codon:yes stop_codon:yes gene_type:complete